MRLLIALIAAKMLFVGDVWGGAAEYGTVAVACAWLFWLFAFKRTGSGFKLDRIEVLLVLIVLIGLVWTGVAFANGFDPIRSAGALLRLVLMFVVYHALRRAAGRNATGFAEWCGFFVLFLHISAGLIKYYLGLDDVVGDVIRPSGLAGHPNTLSNIAFFGALIASAYLFAGRFHAAVPVKAYGVLLVLSFWMIVVSGTLKNLLVLVPALVVVTLSTGRIKSSRVVATLAFSIAIIALAWWFEPIQLRIVEALAAGIDLSVSEGERLGSSFQWRILQWKLLINDWIANYFWFGSGTGQVGSMQGLADESGIAYSAHSDLVTFLVELGFVGFLAFSVANFAIGKELGRARSNREDGVPVVAIFVSLWMMGLGGNVFYSAAYTYLLWFYAGLNRGIGLAIVQRSKLLSKGRLGNG